MARLNIKMGTGLWQSAWCMAYRELCHETWHVLRFEGVEEETLMYFPRDCSALARARLLTLGQAFFGTLKEISDRRVGELVFFMVLKM